MRVLLAGATGYIGTSVAEALRAAGHAVSGLARSDDAAARLAAMGLEAVRGDFADPPSVAAAARASDGTILAATSGVPGIDAAAVGAVLAALAGSGKPLIYTSGIWSYGDTGGRVVTETSHATPTPRVAWRSAVEREVLAAAADGVRSIVLQPAVVFGRGGGLPAKWSDSARRDGAAKFVGTGENRWAVVHVDDLADLYVRALERAPGGTLLIASAGPSVRVADMARAASEGAGAEGRVTAWPVAQARRKLGDYADALALDQQASSRRAEELLGWKP
ncbi:MAG TPA: NAD-dependent epimerase/dehydratase family protein, partial [Gemmatimonadales bacterium]|nr:NAD-dependent epimerase/dehydratase family protein [Gemmatimonadales bacterium]